MEYYNSNVNIERYIFFKKVNLFGYRICKGVDIILILCTFYNFYIKEKKCFFRNLVLCAEWILGLSRSRGLGGSC